VGCDAKNDASYCSVINGHFDVAKCLIENGAMIDADEALMMSVEKGNLNAVKHFVGNGANICADNESALETADALGYIEIVEFLENWKRDHPL